MVTEISSEFDTKERQNKATFRLVVWNCAQALHQKCHVLEELKPDIAIIPECAAPNVLTSKAPDFKFNQCIWDGRNPNKGLGVFSFGDFEIEKYEVRSPSAYIFIPVRLTNPFEINILAVWAFNHRNPIDSHINTSEIIKSYSEFLQSPNTIAAGDFNHNVIWDKGYPEHRFIDTLEEMSRLSLGSVYHKLTSEEYGKETKATFYWQKNPNQPYHIDYVFTSDRINKEDITLEIKQPEDHLKYSDHVPIILDIALDH